MAQIDGGRLNGEQANEPLTKDSRVSATRTQDAWRSDLPIENFTFIDALSEEQRVDLLRSGTPRAFQEKSTIFQEGDQPDGLYVIESGEIKISFESSEAKEMIVVIYGPGDIVGELGALDGFPRSATATAHTNTTVRFLNTKQFSDYLGRNTPVAFSLLRMLAQRLRQTSDVLEDSLFLGVEPRLAKRLLVLADRFGDASPKGLRFKFGLSQGDLGKTVGLTRESINKTLGKWTRAGILKHEDGVVTIYDLDRLSDIANFGPLI